MSDFEFVLPQTIFTVKIDGEVYTVHDSSELRSLLYRVGEIGGSVLAGEVKEGKPITVATALLASAMMSAFGESYQDLLEKTKHNLAYQVFILQNVQTIIMKESRRVSDELVSVSTGGEPMSEMIKSITGGLTAEKLIDTIIAKTSKEGRSGADTE